MGFTGSYAAMFNSREIPVPVVSARCLNNKEKEMDEGLYTLSLVCEPLLSVHLKAVARTDDEPVNTVN